MIALRFAIAVALLTCAVPAAAQPPFNDADALRAQQEAAQRRAIDQANQIQALEARLQAEQAIADLRSAQALVILPAVQPDPKAPLAAGTPPGYPSIPDAVLADSNRRVQAAKPR